MPKMLTLEEIYGEGAPTYDAIWADVLLPVTRRVVERMPLGERRCLLDLASGTGKALEPLRAVAPRARIVALDRTRSMLAVRPAAFPAVQCDLVQLGLRDGAADAGLLAFALFHVGDPGRALREVARVLAPGGIFGVAVWAERDIDPVMDTAWVAALERHGAPDMEPPPRTDGSMDTQDKLRALLRDAGFPDVTTWSDAIDWRPSLADYVTYRTQMGLFGRRYNAMSPDARRAFLVDARAALEAIPEADRVDRSQVICAVATR